MKEVIAKKSLGQNFLKDEIVLQKIANSFEVSGNDLIIEVGPGMGALTKYLVQKPSDLICYEIDERMQDILLKFKNDKVNIIFDDFLKRKIKDDIKKDYKNIYVIANIPYYITTPIIEHILNSEIVVNGMTLLVQKEVAERFSALPGTKNYGYFTVLLNHYFNVEILFDVSPKAFDPAPKVTSSVVKLTRKATIYSLDINKFKEFLKIIFKQKRKTLKNNLKGFDWNIIKDVLIENNININCRAEELSYEVLIMIFNSVIN